MKTIICDLDGTLCNADHRRHFVEQKPKNFKAFYEAAKNDEPNQWCVDILEGMDHLLYSVVFVTGRPEEYRQLTINWLETYIGDKTSYHLAMRKTGDYRQDYIVKQEIYDEYLKDLDILFCIDDRQQVVNMWRRNGLVCLQCAEGDF